MRIWLSFLLGTLVCFSSAEGLAKARREAPLRKAEFKSDITPISAFVGQPLSLDLRTLLKSPGVGTLVWSTGADKPAWLTLKSAENLLVGTPTAADLGTKSFRLAVQDGDAGALTRVDITVYPPPKWKQNPIDLEFQREDFAWSLDLNTKVDNPGGGKLTYTVENPALLPAWMTLDASGLLSGTPKRKDVGKYSGVVFVVTSSLGGFDKAPASGEVLKTIHPPKWLKNPIMAANAAEDFPYSFDLGIPDFVSNPENGVITYKLKSPSSWLQLTSSGTLFGTPKKMDLGPVTLQVELSSTLDGNVYTDATTVTLTVVHTNHPPEWKMNPILLPDAPTKIPYVQDLVPFAMDRDGDPLTFKIVSGPKWISLTKSGMIGGTPATSDFGVNEWTIEVADAEFSIPTQVRVKVTNAPPYWLNKPTVLANAKEDENYLQNLIPLVKDPDGDAVTFEKVSGPAWITVTAAGALSGKPGADQLGLNKVVVRVTDNVSGKDEAEVQITVDHVNHPPIWTQDPVPLPNAKEKVAYTQALTPFVLDKDKGDTLTFSKLAGPAWATVSAAGQIAGTPGRADVGLNTFKVRVTDSAGAFADATVPITVEKTNRPPVWTQDPIDLGQTLEGEMLNAGVAKFALDADGDPLTFRKISGPAWVTVAADGTVSGSPKRPDAGAYTVVIETSDGEYAVTAKANGTVKAKTLPPVIHAEQLDFTVKERLTFNVALSQVKFVEDPQGLPLTFTLVDTAPWVTLTATGDLTLKPLFPQIGDHNFRIKVSNGALTTDGNIHVKVLRDPRPPVWLEDPILFKTLARVPFAGDIGAKAKDLDGLAITFTKKSGPAWLSIDSAGKLSGTPGDADVGDNRFVVTVKNDLLGADASVVITVMPNNHPPFWTKDPITLPTAITGMAYSQDIGQYAKDADAADTLTITKISGPDWVKVSPSGLVTGTPAKTDVGNVMMKVRVTDPSLAAADATVTFTVEKANTPPVWLQEPIDLGEVVQESTLTFDLTKFAFDGDGDALTYKKISGPAWIFVGTAGDLKGTPMAADIGAINAVFEVSDGKAAAQVKAIGKVIPKNHPPVIHAEALNFTVKERATLTAVLNDPKYVEDMDHDNLVFSLIEKAPWVSLAADGTLTLKPLHADIGTHAYKFTVTDGKLSAQGVLNIQVLRDPRPPIWLEDPIRLEANARLPFAANIADKAKDLDGMPLTFSKKSGPAWLTVDATGKISGTPQDADVGENRFVLVATNDGLSADGNLVITVKPTNHAPVVNNDALKFTVKERSTFTVSLNDKKYVDDVDNDTLLFQAAKGLEWANLTGDGTLTLKPLYPQIGNHTLNFTVSDGKLTATGTIQITVVRDPRPPVWLEDPVRFEATSREPFTGSVAGKAKDLDGIAITYSKKSGPAWLTVGSDGSLSGTPGDADAGENKLILTAKNDLLGADGNVIVTVKLGNHGPVIHDDQLVFTMKERQVLDVNLTDKKYVEDQDGDSLVFSWIDKADWAKLSSAGQLHLTPAFAQIGTHAFPFRVTDGKLTAQGTIKIRVLRDPRPPVWLEDPIRFEAKTGRPFSANIAAKVKELDGVPISFTKKSGAAWLSIDTAGNLSGTPPESPLGESKFVITASNDGSSSDGNVIINVVLGNNPPIWTQDPINLGSVEVGKLFQASVASYAFDKDGDPLTFEKITGPGWLMVSAAGMVTGTPGDADVGTASMTVRVSDPLKAFSDGTVKIIVTAKPNKPPVWLQDPINLGTLLPDQLFTFDLAPLAKDPDGDGLTFKKVSGPTWLTVASNGQLQGRPTKTDTGSFTAVFEVSDGKASATANAFGTVKNTENLPPIIKPEALSFVVKERTEFRVNINQPQYVVDPEGDPLTFALVTPVEWITLAPNGDLRILAAYKDIGDHSFLVTVTDSKKASVQGTMFIRVLRDPRPPVWNSDPIRMTAKVNVPFSGTLADKAKDLDGIAITFSKLSGPGWLAVAANGALSGTPTVVGEDTFKVNVRNDLLGADATLIITVTPAGGPQVDTEVVDKAVAGATAENLWVIDNSWPWLEYNKMIQQMKESIHVYFDALESAGVRSTGLYLSSDVARWQGMPNQGEDSSLFLKWSDPLLTNHFISRMNESYNKKCYTSPIWAMYKFYQLAPGQSEISSGFFKAPAPMDVLIATVHTDYYKTFSKKTPQEKWTAVDYGKNFQAFHDAKKQNYRISAIASDCQKLLDPMEEGEQTAKDNPYRTLTKMTKGDYFTWDCSFNMEKTLKDYAQKVIFRSFVTAKEKIALSKTPVNPAAIQVYVGGTLLTADQWKYEPNVVLIYWNKIDISALKTGDLIEIKYTAM